MLQDEFVNVAHRSEELRVQQLWSLNLARLKGKFHARIMCVAELYVRWWNLLQEAAPNIAACRELGLNIQQGIVHVREMWHLFVSTSSVLPSMLGLYVHFYQHLIGDPHKAAKIREKYDEYIHTAGGLSESITFRGCGPDDGIIEVSAKRDSMGEIVAYNRSFCQMTGYVPGELLKTNILGVMPEIYRAAHTRALEECGRVVEYGGKWSLAKNVRVHLLCKSGYVVPAVLKIVDLPHFVNGHSFVAGMSRVKEFENYNVVRLLLDPKLGIAATSSSIIMTPHAHIDCGSYFRGVQPGNDPTARTSVCELVENFNRISGDKREPAVISREKQRREFVDRVVLCQYDKIQTKQSGLLGYEVRLFVVPRPPNLVPYPVCRSDAELVYSLRFNQFIISRRGEETPGKGQDDYLFYGAMRSRKNTQDEFMISKDGRRLVTSQCGNSADTNPGCAVGFPKGYYKAVLNQIVCFGLDPASVPLWKRVSCKRSLWIVRIQGGLRRWGHDLQNKQVGGVRQGEAGGEHAVPEPGTGAGAGSGPSESQVANELIHLADRTGQVHEDCDKEPESVL